MLTEFYLSNFSHSFNKKPSHLPSDNIFSRLATDPLNLIATEIGLDSLKNLSRVDKCLNLQVKQTLEYKKFQLIQKNVRTILANFKFVHNECLLFNRVRDGCDSNLLEDFIKITKKGILLDVFHTRVPKLSIGHYTYTVQLNEINVRVDYTTKPYYIYFKPDTSSKEKKQTFTEKGFGDHVCDVLFRCDSDSEVMKKTIDVAQNEIDKIINYLFVGLVDQYFPKISNKCDMRILAFPISGCGFIAPVGSKKIYYIKNP